MESSFDIKKLISVLLHNWYWFVISVFVCCGIAVYVVLSTPPMYKRDAILLIKESNTRRSATSDVEAMLSQVGQTPSKLANEIVVFQSPALMSEVVERLGLTTEYALEGRLRNTVVYASRVPVLVDFSQVPSEISVSLTVTPKADGVLGVSGIKYFEKGEKYKLRDVYEIKSGDSLDLPFGKVTFTRNPYYYSDKPWKNPEKVTKRTLRAATSMFMSEFSASTHDSSKRMSDVLNLTLTDYNVNRAEDIINMLITVYNEKWVIDNNKMAASTSVFIEDRLATIAAELNKVDNTISEYKTKNKIPDVTETSRMYTSEVTDIVKQVRELESQISVAKYLRNFLKDVDDATLIPLPSGINSQGIASQVTEYNNILLNRNSLLAASSEKNPMVVELSEALVSLKDAIIRSVDNYVATLEEQEHIALTQQSQTETRIAQSPSQAMDLIKYERLQKVQENLYLYLLQKREENELSQAFSAYNTRIVNPPYGSNTPVSPRRMHILLLAFLIGLALPSAYFYLMIVTDTKIHSKKDLDNLTISYLGEIPQVGSPSKGAGKLIDRLIKKQDGNEPLSKLVIEKGSRNISNEAFRIIRANLEFACKPSSDKVIMVTSFNPGAGKTFLNVNLSSAMAINGKKVLLIDADFRRLTLSTFLGLKHKGLADYLASPKEDIDGYITKNVNFENLDVLPVGTLPPNPSELLTNGDITGLMEELKKKYDYIFLDCPPIDIVADTQIIAPCADRTLFVARAGLFDKNQIPDIDKIKEEGKYKNLTLVLNGTTAYGGGYYHRGYGYGYGYGYRKDGGYYSSVK